MDLVFRGFQIRANRISGNVDDILGEFTEIPENSQKQIWYSATNESVSVNESVNFNSNIPVVLIG